ncbi:Catalytic LigB subunit of aromatic ring-opening dioxygenase family protein [Aspergillus niger]|uniref:Catalytic LigB subunit of aromatic ring-opening dioxygenase family protein n=1 Tax=Aspergillus niger TaxID=5061 RepID=A0A505IAQ0_ASPNG|nr:Catalytic LigB subunit of aromatic ring-opening dioxygenase family protein [Aspergillus niger]
MPLSSSAIDTRNYRNSMLVLGMPRRAESQAAGLIPAYVFLYMPDIWDP